MEFVPCSFNRSSAASNSSMYQWAFLPSRRAFGYLEPTPARNLVADTPQYPAAKCRVIRRGHPGIRTFGISLTSPFAVRAWALFVHSSPLQVPLSALPRFTAPPLTGDSLEQVHALTITTVFGAAWGLAWMDKGLGHGALSLRLSAAGPSKSRTFWAMRSITSPTLA